MLYLSAAPDLDEHHTGFGHPERPSRVTAALAGLREARLDDALVHLPPRRATYAELELVHSPHYLRELEDFCHGGGGHLDPDTVASSGSFTTALLAVGGALQALEALEASRDGVAFVAHRPPGHHATSDQAMGFCLVNTVAVAAARLAGRGERVLVLDWDVHHGNGTQAIFWDDPRVLYISTHQSPLYPGTGSADARGGTGAEGLTVNIPLPPGATGDVLLAAFDQIIKPAVAQFAPTWVLISSGFDGHRADPLAELALSAGDYAAMAAQARELVSAPGRVLVVMEGGYDLGAVTMSAGAVMASLLEQDYRPEPPTSGGPGREAVERLRARLAR
ncbi:MAG TPA: histone deacetylase [Acidimicrobiales bacterium]|nr:histone deacetylase [Acidimicrobiales bacterium]